MHTTDAIVLSFNSYAESDALVSFYTRNFGKINVRARGVKKVSTKQGAFLHEPAILRCSFIIGKNGYILSGVNSQQEFFKTARDLFARGYAMSFLALCDTLLYEGQSDERLWQLINSVMRDAELISDSARGQEELWRAEKQWLVTLLDILGLRPQLDFSRVNNKKQFDYYILRLLESKFETPVTFFGLGTTHN